MIKLYSNNRLAQTQQAYFCAILTKMLCHIYKYVDFAL